MLSEEKCRQLLGNFGKKLSGEQIQAINQYLWNLAELYVEQYYKLINKQNHEKSSNYGQSEQ